MNPLTPGHTGINPMHSQALLSQTVQNTSLRNSLKSTGHSGSMHRASPSIGGSFGNSSHRAAPSVDGSLGNGTNRFVGAASNLIQRNRESKQETLALKDQDAIPLQELLVIVYRIKRMKLLKEAMLFLVTILIFISVMLSIAVVHTSWDQTHAVKDLLFDEEFEGAQYKKNFHDVMQQGEFFEWLEGPMLNGLWPETWYNGDAISEKELGYVLLYNRLVGGVQLRQLRVSSDSCNERRYPNADFNNDGLGDYDTKDGTCFTSFTVGDQDKATFVGANSSFQYAWSDGHSRVVNYDGFGPTSYGTGGYVTFLPANNRTSVVETIERLKRDRWLDRGTRAVVVDITLYNTNTRLATVVRVLFEFFESGNVFTSYEIMSFRIVFYQAKTSFLRAGLEACFVLVFCVLVFNEWTRVWRFRPHYYHYFFDSHNIMAVLFIITILITLSFWYVFVSSKYRREFDVNSEVFVDYNSLAQKFRWAMNFASIVVILSFVKGFRYLSLNKQVYILWVTLGHAMLQLSAFLMVFSVIISAFAISAMMVFGQHTQDFHSFGASVSTLVRWVFGDFNYEDLEVARPMISAVFFYPYFILVYMIFFNMLIAIIVSAFENVHSFTAQREGWKECAPSIIVDMSNVLKYKFKTLGHVASCGICSTRSDHRSKTVKSVELSARNASLPLPHPASSTEGGSEEAREEGKSTELPSIPSVGTMADESVSSNAADESGDWHSSEHREFIMQQHLWKLVHEAMQVAKQRKPPTFLFEHFESTYQLMRLNYGATDGFGSICNVFISEEELRGIIGVTSDEQDYAVLSNRKLRVQDRATILAKEIVETYHKLNEVTMLHALRSSTTTGPTVLGKHKSSADDPKRRNLEFHVTKINKWGMRQRRVFVVDDEQLDVRSYGVNKMGERGSLRKRLPLMHLVQVEKSVINSCRLRLVFREEVDVGDQDLLFMPYKNSTAEQRRNRFLRLLIDVVRKSTEAQSFHDAGL